MRLTPIKAARSTVILLTGGDLAGPEKLLKQDDPGQLMRHRLRAEADPLRSGLQSGRRQSFLPADQEADIDPGKALLIEPGSPFPGGTGLAVLVERDDPRPLGQPFQKGIVVSHGDEFEAQVSTQELQVVGFRVAKGIPRRTDCEKRRLHRCDTREGYPGRAGRLVIR